ncbi:MAG: ATP-binding cassette domain-containing protein [Bacilli bacterium]|nr:ATP-binding cassette domain-containing protein [Bacilli bacterium]MBN2877775.1 ATP-binding cassette domain-containing protein [Bacilli bacterium]
MNHIIEVNGLKKNYGPIEAVKGIDFYVEEGSLFAFLGPNGAGKSTTINILSTLLTNDAGSVVVNGNVLGDNDDSIRKSIGIVFQDSVLDPLLSVHENLETRGSFYGLDYKTLQKRIEIALEVTGITDLAKRKYGSLSGGQRRRTDIARALIHQPRILFLDEPTTGLDPQTRRNVWETIKQLQASENMTVFLTTHYMEEAEEAGYVVIIDEGVIAAKGTPTELKDQFSHDSLRVKAIDDVKMDKYIKLKKLSYVKRNDLYIIQLDSTLDSISILNDVSDNLSSFQVFNGTLDDAFIEVTGKEIRE